MRKLFIAVFPLDLGTENRSIKSPAFTRLEYLVKKKIKKYMGIIKKPFHLTKITMTTIKITISW